MGLPDLPIDRHAAISDSYTSTPAISLFVLFNILISCIHEKQQRRRSCDRASKEGLVAGLKGPGQKLELFYIDAVT